MKYKYLFGLVLFMMLFPASVWAGTVQLPRTGQATCYDTNGMGVSCPGTGQDGAVQAGVNWPSPRFTYNSNGTITDNLTGLTWLTNANCAGTMTWANALTWSKSLASGVCGLTDGSEAGDWHLPNVVELESLVGLQNSYPSLPTGHPFVNVLPSDYWSSSTDVSNTSYAWIVNMYDGSVYETNKANDNRLVWPVRGGQSGAFGSLVIDLSSLKGKKVGGALFLDAPLDDITPYKTFYLEKAGTKVAKITMPNLTPINLSDNYGNLGSYVWTNMSGAPIVNWSDVLTETTPVAFRILADHVDGNSYATQPFNLSYQGQVSGTVSADKTFPQTAPVTVTYSASGAGCDMLCLYRWLDPAVATSRVVGNNATFTREYLAGGTDVIFLEITDVLNNITYIPVQAVLNMPYSSGNPAESGRGRLVNGVDVTNGNFYLSSTEMSVPGKGISFNLTRSYNSSNNSWTFNVDQRLEFVWGRGNRQVSVLREDGRKQLFYRDTDAKWYGLNPGNFDKLVEQADGSFKLYTKGSTIYTFAKPGASGISSLSSISDRDGNQMTITVVSALSKTVTDSAGRLYTLAYNTAGQLEKATNFSGRFVQYTYDAGGLLIGAQDLRNFVTHYAYSGGHLVTVTDPRENAVLTVGYNANGKVQSVKDANGNETQYGYYTGYTVGGVHYPGTVTSVVRPPTVGAGGTVNNNLAFVYDSLGKVTHEISAVNYGDFKTTKAYNPVSDPKRSAEQGLVASVTNPRSKTTNFGYSADGRGNQTVITNPLSQSTNMDYKTEIDLYPTPAANQTNLNLMKEMKTPLNSTYNFGHTDTGNVQSITNPLSRTTNFHYTGGLVDQLTDPKGYTTGYTYDANGNVRRVTDIAGNYVEYAYDTLGRTTDVRDKRGYITHYTYDAAGHVLTATSAYGTARAATVTNTYDENGNLRTVQDARGNTRTYTYNKLNQVATESFTVGGQTYTRTNAYDELNRLKQVTNENSHANAKTFDAAGRVTTETDPLANSTTYTYDENGNVLTITDSLGRKITYEYDALDRVLTKKDNLNNTVTYTYDADGRVKTFKDAKNNTTTYDYYADGSLWKVTDAAGKVTESTYDEAGNLLTVKDPNLHTTTYGYDNLHRMTSMKDPENRTWTYAYDANGNLSSYQTPDNNTTQYAYDELNRLTRITWPDASTVSYTYDQNGNRTSMVDASGTTSYTYDEANRLSSVTDSFGKTVGHTYDGVGNVKSIVYPGSKTVNYAYDAGERLSTVTNWLAATTTYTYNNINQITQIVNGNGTKAIYSYDNANRLTGLQNQTSSGATITSHAYTLDNNGNVTKSQVDVPTLPAFTSNKNLTYDAVNRIITAGATSFSHDTNGRIISEVLGGQTINYGYNYRDLLTSITGGADTYSFIYNGDGNRIAKTKSGTQTKYILDVSGSLPDVLAETDASGNITSYYTYGAGLLSRIDAASNQEYFYHYDPTGNTLALTNSGQSIVASYGYSPYGETTATGVVYNPFRYSGQHGVMDDGNGLIHMRARYYKPSIARFMSLDPVIGDMNKPQSLNRYAYVQGDPIGGIDPSGLYSWNEFGSDLYKYGIEANVKMVKRAPEAFSEIYDATVKDVSKDIISGCKNAPFEEAWQKKAYWNEAYCVTSGAGKIAGQALDNLNLPLQISKAGGRSEIKLLKLDANSENELLFLNDLVFDLISIRKGLGEFGAAASKIQKAKATISKYSNLNKGLRKIYSNRQLAALDKILSTYKDTVALADKLVNEFFSR